MTTMTIASVNTGATVTKRVAYVAVNEFMDPDTYGISVCVEDESGHRPLSDYAGPYTRERAEGIAKRLNERLGVSAKVARRIVASTMRVGQ